MGKVRQIVLGHCEGEVIETNPIDAKVLVLYSRLRALLEGIHVLIGARLAEEAMFLARELFTDSLRLMELADRESDKASLILGMEIHSLGEWENLEKQALALGESTGTQQARVREAIETRRKAVERYRQRHGVGALLQFADEKQLAPKHGRLGEYMDFQFAHRMIHDPVIAQQGRLGRLEDVVTISMRSTDDEILAAVSGFAMLSAVHGHKACAHMFGWSDVSMAELDKLIASVEALNSG